VRNYVLEDNGTDTDKSYFILAWRCTSLHNKNKFLSSIKKTHSFPFQFLFVTVRFIATTSRVAVLQHEENTED